MDVTSSKKQLESIGQAIRWRRQISSAPPPSDQNCFRHKFSSVKIVKTRWQGELDEKYS